MDPTGNAMLTRSSTEVETMVADLTSTILKSRNMSRVKNTSTTSSRPLPVGGANGSHRMGENPSADDWEEFRPIITHHYMRKGLPLRVVRDILEREYGFFASERMYKLRVLEKWGLKKNYTQKPREPVIRVLEETGSEQSPCNLPPINGRPVDMRKIERSRAGPKAPGRHRRRPSNLNFLENNRILEEVGFDFSGSSAPPESGQPVENNLLPITPPSIFNAPETFQVRHWQQSSIANSFESNIVSGEIGFDSNGSSASPESGQWVENDLLPITSPRIFDAPENFQGSHWQQLSSANSLENIIALEEAQFSFSGSSAIPESTQLVEDDLLAVTLPRTLDVPDIFKIPEYILAHIDQYYIACFLGQGQLFSHQTLGSVAVRVMDVDDGFTDMGLLEIHDPGYAAISLAKSRQYRHARILLGEAQDKLKNLLRAQHPTFLPFILEIICEDSTTPEFNVSESFRRYVCDLCAIIMGPQHPLTMILHLLGLVEYKLETCAMILSKIQTTLSAEFGASQWEARRPVKVFCRVLRHLGRYDEIEQILHTAYDGIETPSQSELLGLLYELAWLSARGRHDKTAATQLFMKILRRTSGDAQTGRISHFRIKALRGLGVLAREESQHEVSEQYFSAALQESRRGYGRRDSNTVRIGNELEESLRKLGRVEEADQLKREREERFLDEDAEAVLI